MASYLISQREVEGATRGLGDLIGNLAIAVGDTGGELVVGMTMGATNTKLCRAGAAVVVAGERVTEPCVVGAMAITGDSVAPPSESLCVGCGSWD